jgi:hypothetical protein
MPDDLREELEATAQKRGHTLTDEVVARLRSSLARERDSDQNPAVKALIWVIAQLAKRISGGTLHNRELRLEEQKKWRTDRFRFRAFKFAVGKLLDALEPVGEIQSPIREFGDDEDDADFYVPGPELQKLMTEIFKAPETYGDFIFGALWADLKKATPLTEKEERLARISPRFGDLIKREFYGFNKARHDLGIDEPKGGKL